MTCNCALQPCAEQAFLGVVDSVDEPVHPEPVHDPPDAHASQREQVEDAERPVMQVEVMRSQDSCSINQSIN